jgi:hypothetical protein
MAIRRDITALTLVAMVIPAIIEVMVIPGITVVAMVLQAITAVMVTAGPASGSVSGSRP